MRHWGRAFVLAAGLFMASCTHGQSEAPTRQPIIDLHRHTSWPGDSDSEALSLIRQEMVSHNVVAAALFITDREDVAHYLPDERTRFLLSPMFPCPALTAERKWCFTETGNMMPNDTWLEQQLAAGKLGGIGELVFNYAAVRPDDLSMEEFWALAAGYDVPAFVHTGRGPDAGLGPRRHPGCCPNYQADYGNPALLRPILEKYPNLRLVLQHVGFDYLDETIALMRDFPLVYAEMSVLNSVGPRSLHDASLRRLVDAGLADRIVLGSDDQDYAPIVERIEGATFLTPEQRRGIYYDNAARFLRLEPAVIAADYAR